MPLLAGPVLAVRQVECTLARICILAYTFNFTPLLWWMSSPLAGHYACVDPAHCYCILGHKVQITDGSPSIELSHYIEPAAQYKLKL